jgi:hypothetical protein
MRWFIAAVALFGTTAAARAQDAGMALPSFEAKRGGSTPERG